MLTIFAVPKAFRGHFAIIQENAISSWTKIEPKCEIILFGNDRGVENIAKKYKVKHFKEVKTNDFGTPLLSDVFEKARKVAKNPVLAYLNADIIFLNKLEDILKRINFKKFLISGRRWDLNVNYKVDFNSNWQNKLMLEIKRRGKLGPMGALDYFIFPKTIDFKMPSFAVGRGVWDNWLIYKAKSMKIPVIDATEMITAIHQKHSYDHAGGFNAVWFGQERRENLKLAKDKKRPFNLVNSDWILLETSLSKPQFSTYRSWRNFQILPVTNPGSAILFWPPVLIVELLVKIYQKLKNFLRY